ncbi:hypothetical protein HGRIS_012716 [Hohenbuehelia grisea]|uniref:Fanconi-associated nuclease n=1 Tax=Hohenbuehelia grisea TaxID=104357 RepID=A0ABR3ITA0_9AGAR
MLSDPDIRNFLIYGCSSSEQHSDNSDTCCMNDSAPSAPVAFLETDYVNNAQDALDELTESCSHVLTAEDRHLIDHFKRLPTRAKYLLLVLLWQHGEQWCRLDTLKVESKLESYLELLPSLQLLCKLDPTLTNPENAYQSAVKQEFMEETMDESILRSTTTQPERNDRGAHSFVFCHDEAGLSLAELLHCLSPEELKSLAKQMKVKVPKDPTQLIWKLLDSSSTQRTLYFGTKPASQQMAPGSSSAQPSASSLVLQTQQHRLLEMVMKLIGKYIRVDGRVVALFRRLHIMYSRCTREPAHIFPPYMLCATPRCCYPPSDFRRDQGIWSNAREFTEYEEALATEADIHHILKTPRRTTRRSTLSRTPAPWRRTTTPASGWTFGTPGASASTCYTATQTLRLVEDNDAANHEVLENASVQTARLVKEKFQGVYPQWKALAQVKFEPGTLFEGPAAGLMRLYAGQVYLRIIERGAEALAILGDYELELEVMESLLAQNVWGRTRCGAWYERRAVLLRKMASESVDQVLILGRARQGLQDAISDSETALVYRPGLLKNLFAIEKKLKLPLTERTAQDKWNPPDTVLLEANVAKVFGRAPMFPAYDGTSQVHLSQFPSQRLGRGLENMKKSQGKWAGKGGAPVNIDRIVSQYYEAHGFRTWLSASQILPTLFGLLFWDILFADYPGSFETPFQHAPLDIVEDTFILPRSAAIARRLSEISDGQAETLILTMYDQHRETKPCCVGVRWNVGDCEDLVNIAHCLGPSALATICQLFCENYVTMFCSCPDLLAWDPQSNICKLIKIHGRRGNASLTVQKAYFTALARAGIVIEICKVVDKASTTHSIKLKGKGKEKAHQSKSDRDLDEDDDSEDDQLDDDDARGCRVHRQRTEASPTIVALGVRQSARAGS